MTREVILLLLRCLSTEPEFCGPAVEAAGRDPGSRQYVEALLAEARAVAIERR
jgi:hypothetical protein